MVIIMTTLNDLIKKILKYVRVDMLICPGIWVIEAAAYLYTLIGF